ncbi:ubiquitin carboxyl-terminal hydrolase 20-like [Babylonia areolata]|uniref:ubiquitin carboxyl-terminal hydrolase 20-like n=1 Tax=Babylonia areolata TaxID=304850 RepID=UPI003FCF3B39
MDSSEPGTRSRAVVKSWCPHIRILSPALCWEEIRRRQSDKPECDTCCLKGANLWLCLARGCSNVGCGLSAQHHSQVHGKEFHHYLTINLSTLRLWCFACEVEVFPGHNNPPLNIPEVVAANTLKPMARCESSANSSPQRSTSGADDSDSDMDDDSSRPRGLTGLQNLGNTCYLNSAVQALSNCPPLTRFFLDCQGCIRPDRSPMLSKSYAKLISELWHKKRLSYVVPSGIVSGIKVVHPMFRGYTQQDAQEFLRCFMDQLHEELKYPVVTSDDEDDNNEDEEEEEDDDEDNEGQENDPESGIASPTDPGAQSLAGSLGGGGGGGGGGDSRRMMGGHDRQNSVDSSGSECEYETCDSGLSSEMGSQADPALSSDDNSSDINEHTLCLPPGDENRGGEKGGPTTTATTTSPNHLSPAPQHRQNKNRNSFSSAASAGSGVTMDGENVDRVANLKEMKETANLLSKMETDNARNQGLVKSESGEYLDALSDSAPPAANTRSKTAAAAAQQQQQQQQQQLQQQQRQQQQQQQHQQQLYQEVAASRAVPSVKQMSLPTKRRRPKNIQYESVISHIFDGKILSSVQCLYCERVSTTKETFQDLSLPIPSKDYLQVLHSGHPSLAPGGGGAMGGPRGGACGDQLGTQSWFSWVFSWMKSFFVGPTITLRDCLSAFFSADELKGDNMYSCDQCKKLRNGLKFSKVLELPEVLCIHLKRFRHEFFSSKINTYISFPLHSLDMKPYLHKDCKNEVTLYDLVGVVCHHGTAGGGHYTAYCLNTSNDQWYEYDDMYVTEVDVSQVINCEAYVLFYRKTDEHMHNLRMKAVKIRESDEPSLMQFYVSKQWINRFNTFAEPGPISNRDFLCKHGGVPPHKVNHVEQLVEPLGQSVWELLYSRFGGGPVVNRLYPCQVCQEELDLMKARQKWEMESFVALNNEFMSGEVHYPVIHALSMAWFRQWEAFVKTKTDMPPGPIDNSRIMVYRNGQPHLRPTADYGQLSPDMWRFLQGIYGGGPEAVLRQRTVSNSQSSTNSNTTTPPSSSSSPPSAAASKETATTASGSTTSAFSSITPSSSSSTPHSPTPSPPLPPTANATAAAAAAVTTVNVGGSEEGASTEGLPSVPSTAVAALPADGSPSSSLSSSSSCSQHAAVLNCSNAAVTGTALTTATTTTTPTPTPRNNSSSSSSTSTLTPCGSTPKLSEDEAGETQERPKPPAMLDSGDSMEESESGSRSLSRSGSGSGPSTAVGTVVDGMQEIKGIPQSMDVTRL